jgi:hypothetical protein
MRRDDCEVTTPIAGQSRSFVESYTNSVDEVPASISEEPVERRHIRPERFWSDPQADKMVLRIAQPARRIKRPLDFGG